MFKHSRILYSLMALLAFILSGCSSHAPPPSGNLADSVAVVAELNDQLGEWHGTPYRYGGLGRGGIDCSGFVFRTFRDRFGVASEAGEGMQLAAMRFAVDDLDTTAALLDTHDVACARTGQALVIPAEASFGATLIFEPAS